MKIEINLKSFGTLFILSMIVFTLVAVTGIIAATQSPGILMHGPLEKWTRFFAIIFGIATIGHIYGSFTLQDWFGENKARQRAQLQKDFHEAQPEGENITITGDSFKPKNKVVQLLKLTPEMRQSLRRVLRGQTA